MLGHKDGGDIGEGIGKRSVRKAIQSSECNIICLGTSFRAKTRWQETRNPETLRFNHSGNYYIFSQK